MKKMKKMTALMLALVLVCGLFGCTRDPEETTTPPETILPVVTDFIGVEGTEPPAPVIPETHICLNEMVAGTDITIMENGRVITLTEDDLTVTMATDSRKVKRNGDLTGIMKREPVISDGKVYIHEAFYRDFFCKEGTDEVSLFHGALFYVVEVLDALQHPDESEFNRKVSENVCLPGSMGIEIPRLNVDRIYLEGYMTNEQYMEAKAYGYREADTHSEYVLVMNSLTLKEAGLSETDDETTVGEYDRLNPKRHELMNDQHAAFFEEKQILNEDFWYLFQWFHGGFMEQSDEDLIAALETCYITDLMFKLEWDYPEK